MKTTLLLLAILPVALFGRSWRVHPMPQFYHNNKGDLMLRVHVLGEAHCALFHYDRTSQTFEKRSDFVLRPNSVGGNREIVVSEDGDRLVFITGVSNWNTASERIAILITNAKGKVLFKHTVEDLFSDEEIERIREIDQRDIGVWLDEVHVLKNGVIFLNVKEAFTSDPRRESLIPNFRLNIETGNFVKTNEVYADRPEHLVDDGYDSALKDTQSISNQSSHTTPASAPR